MNGSPILDQEELSRFLFENNDFTERTGNVRWNRFMPVFCEKFDRFETSMFRSSLLNRDEEIWEMGDNFAGVERKAVKARATLEACQIRRKMSLAVEPETAEHPLHAVVINWPSEKDAQIEICKELRKEAKLFVR